MSTDSEPSSSTPRARTQLTAGLLYVAQISGIVTVIAGTIYVLGLFALLLPILRDYDVSFDNAWYMVSLVPKTVIAGHGVKSLVWPALFTVIPIAFVVVLVLTLVRIASDGVRRGQYHTSVVENKEHLRGVPLITAIYLAYGGVLGGILLALHRIVEGTRFPVPGAFLQFHIVAGALAYGILAALCLLTLSLLTWRGGRYVIRLIRTEKFSYLSLKELLDLRLSLYLASYIGMACVTFSSILLVDLLVSDELSAGPVFSAWTVALESLIVLAPAMLTLLLLNNVLSSELLERLGPRLARIGAVLKALLSLAVFCTALGLISLFFASLVVNFLQGDSRLFGVLVYYEIADLSILLLLFVMVMLLLLLGRAIPFEAFGGAGANIRFAYILVMVVCTSVLSWSVVWFVRSSVEGEFSQNQWPWLRLFVSLLVFVILGAIVLLLLLARGVRFIARRVMGMSPVAFTSPTASGRSLSTKVRRLRSWRENVDDEVLAIARYMGALFGAFYLTLLVTFLHGRYIIWPLIDNVNSISRSTSLLDEAFLYLTIAGGIASGALLYRGLFHSGEESFKEDLLSAKDWRTFLKRFWKTERPRPRWRVVAWAIAGAYAFSVIIGSLIAYLEEPPLPQVQLVEKGNVVQPDASASAEEPGLHSSTKSLLAHTDGYWYLLNEDDGNLVVVPDQSNSLIKMPGYVDVVDERRSLKIEVPSEWVEHFSDYPPAWPEGSASARSSKLAVSTNVDNWGKDYTTPGAFVEVFSAEKWYRWSGNPVNDNTVTEESIDAVEAYRPDCGAPDEGPAEYDLGDEEHRYSASIIRWRGCEEDGGSFAKLVAVPKDRSFVVFALVQFPEDRQTAYDTETDGILRSIEVRSDLLP